MAQITSEDIINKGVYPSNGDKIQFKGYGGIFYSSNPGNCKLCTLDSISYLISTEIEEFVKVVNKLPKLVFNVNLTSIVNVNILKKHFKEVYVQKVPIGYNNTFQYHCCFFTGYEKYSDYIGYKERCDEFINNIAKKPVLNKTTSEIIRELSVEQIVEIKNKRRKDHAELLLTKLLIKD